jgi:hypothetical protein
VEPYVTRKLLSTTSQTGSNIKERRKDAKVGDSDLERLMLAVEKHIPEQWIRLYIERWLRITEEKKHTLM